MIKGLVRVVLVTAVIGLGCASRDLRPGFRNESEVLRRQWVYSFEPLSSGRRLGGLEYVSPVLVEDSLLFGSSRFGLVSYYPKIKRVRWKFEIPNGIISQIEATRDFAYFTGGDGKLYCLSLDNGKPVWTYDLRNPVSSRPKVIGDELYLVTSDDVLLSLEASTGKWKWHYRRRNVSGPVVHGATQPLMVGDSIWVGFADGALVSVSRKDGKVLWERQLNTNKRFSGVNAEFLEKDGVVYVPAYDQALYALQAGTGTPLWVAEGVGGSKKVVWSDGVLYAPSSQGRLHALDPKSGKEFWSFELDGGVPTDFVVTQNQIILGSTQEYLYVLNRPTGRLQFRYPVGYDSGFSGGLAFDSREGWLYAMSRGGNLYSFRYLGQ
jgi:outer membrane protein assembly factor BamB